MRVLPCVSPSSFPSDNSVRRLRNINEVRYVTVRYEPGRERLRSACPDGQFWLMLRGTWQTRIVGHTEKECAPFSLSYHIPGEKNRRVVGRQGATLFGIQIPHRLLHSPILPDTPAEPVFQSSSTANLVAMQLFRASMAGDTASALEAEELLPQLMRLASRNAVVSPARQEPRWVRLAQEYLHAHQTEPITLTEIATLCELHPVYLTAAFRRRFGCSMGEYLRRLRITSALHQLCRTEEDVATIAHAAGFYDQAHFTRVFKAQVGIAPGALRRLMQSA